MVLHQKIIHRTDGPAIIYPDGDIYWLIDGKLFRFKDYIQELKLASEDVSMLILKYGDVVKY